MLRPLITTLIGVFVFTGLISCAHTQGPENSASKAGKMNVLLIVVDDLGAMDITSSGSTFYETPNIDKLAATGVNFTNAYSPSTVCSPSRAALQTGKSPERLKITDWIPGYTAKAKNRRGKQLETPAILKQLPLEEVTLAETFKENGYSTFYAGKWHLGGEGFHPEQQGYEINIGGNHKGSPKSYYSPYKNPQLIDGPNGEYLPDRLTSETLAFMQQQPADKPFFAMLSFYTVHTPIVAAKPHLDYYKKKVAALPELEQPFRKERNNTISKLRQDNPAYASMIHAMDSNIGRLMDGLKQSGLDNNTLVIFTSDNGALTTQSKAAPSSSEPFRGGKGWVYEGGMRIPMIFSLPETLTKKGYVGKVEHPVTLTDIAPTLYSLTGIKNAENREFDGADLSDLVLHNKAINRDTIQAYFPHYHASKSEPSYMLREGDWKLIYFYEDKSIELYNLANDISEQNNLAIEKPELVKRLKSKMDIWLGKTKADLPIKKSLNK